MMLNQVRYSSSFQRERVVASHRLASAFSSAIPAVNGQRRMQANEGVTLWLQSEIMNDELAEAEDILEAPKLVSAADYLEIRANLLDALQVDGSRLLSRPRPSAGLWTPWNATKK
jgi:hypothetical protein